MAIFREIFQGVVSSRRWRTWSYVLLHIKTIVGLGLEGGTNGKASEDFNFLELWCWVFLCKVVIRCYYCSGRDGLGGSAGKERRTICGTSCGYISIKSVTIATPSSLMWVVMMMFCCCCCYGLNTYFPQYVPHQAIKMIPPPPAVFFELAQCGNCCYISAIQIVMEYCLMLL